MNKFLKLALSTALLGFSALHAQNFSEERTGVLLGINTARTQVQTQTQLLWAKAELGGIGLRLGYQKFDEDSIFGSRIYVDYNYLSSQSEDKSFEMEQDLASINLDVLMDYNIPDTQTFIGAFVGINYGWSNYKQKALVPVLLWDVNDEVRLQMRNIGFNVGLAASFASKHRIEVYYKTFPFNKYESTNLSYKNNGGIISVGYQYNF